MSATVAEQAPPQWICCSRKGCATVKRRAHTGRGWVLSHCDRCKTTTDHFPCPEPGKRLPVAGHRGIFNNARSYPSAKRT